MALGMWFILILGLIFFLVGLGAITAWIPEGFYYIGFFGLAFIAVMLFIIGLTKKGGERWRNLFLSSLMLFGLSLLYIYSLGFYLAPLALIFMVLSAKKLASFTS